MTVEDTENDYAWKHFTHIGYYFLIHYTSF